MNGCCESLATQLKVTTPWNEHSFRASPSRLFAQKAANISMLFKQTNKIGWFCQITNKQKLAVLAFFAQFTIKAENKSIVAKRQMILDIYIKQCHF